MRRMRNMHRPVNVHTVRNIIDKFETGVEACGIFRNNRNENQNLYVCPSLIVIPHAKVVKVPDRPRSGRPTTVLTQERIADLVERLERNPHASVSIRGKKIGVITSFIESGLRVLMRKCFNSTYDQRDDSVWKVAHRTRQRCAASIKLT